MNEEKLDEYNAMSKRYINKTIMRLKQILTTIDRSFMRKTDKLILLHKMKNEIIELENKTIEEL